MITCFHFLRLLDPSQADDAATKLRAALGARGAVGRPLDAHAAAAWCLSVRLQGDDEAVLAAASRQVEEVLAGSIKVHKTWSFREAP